MFFLLLQFARAKIGDHSLFPQWVICNRWIRRHARPVDADDRISAILLGSSQTGHGTKPLSR
jgi:hypothetical protein